jgi:CHAT domain-containing protein/Tfp pilus assembly protein PilF
MNRPLFPVLLSLSLAIASIPAAGPPGLPPDEAAQLRSLAVDKEKQAGTLQTQKQWEKAANLWQQAIALRTKIGGPDHWRVLGSQISFANAKVMGRLPEKDAVRLEKAQRLADSFGYPPPKEKLADAIAARKALVSICRELLGEKHPRLIWATRDLGFLQELAGRPNEADQLLGEAVKLAKARFGTGHPGYALALFGRGAFLSRAGKPADAETLFREVVARRDHLLGPDHPETLRAAHWLGHVLGQQRKLPEAARVLADAEYRLRDLKDAELALAGTQITLAGVLQKHGDGAGALRALRSAAAQFNALARYHDIAVPAQRNPALARTMYQRALALKGLPKDDWRQADARAAIARLDRIGNDRGLDHDLDQARELDDKVARTCGRGEYRRALEAARRSLLLREGALGKDHPDVALSLNNLGMLHRALGELDEAMQYLRRAYHLRRDGQGEGHPETALCLNNLGQVHLERGEARQASAALRNSVEALGKALDHRHDAYIDACNNLAVLYQRLGDHARAEKEFVEVIELHKRALKAPAKERERRNSELKGLRHALDGETNWAGTLYELRGVYSRFPSLGEGARRATYLANLGRSRFALDKDREAETAFREALAIYDNALKAAGKLGLKYPAYTTEHAAALNSMALLLLRRKDFRGAKPLLELALDIRKSLREENSTMYAVGLNSLAALAEAQGDHGRAAELLRKALEINRKAGESSAEHAATASNLALVLHGAGKVDEALPLARLAARVGLASINRLAAAQTERQQLARLVGFRGQLDHYLSLTAKDKSADAAYAVALAWKGAVFVRQRLRRERARLEGSARAARLRAELDDVTRVLARFSLGGPTTAKALANLEKRREELERQLAEQAPDVCARLTSQKLTPAALCKALPANAALVDFLEYNHTSFEKGRRAVTRQLAAFVVRRGGVVRLDLGPADAVRKAVVAWRTQLGLKKTGLDETGAAVRKLVWQPLLPRLKGAKVVLLSPDGVLGTVPFAALPGEKKGAYLVEEQALGSVAVPQELPGLLCRKPATGEAALLVMGDVDYGEGKARRWPPLAGTRAEMLTVRDSFEKRYPFPDGQTRVLRGPKATEEMVRRHAPGHRFLHLATHGFFEPKEGEGHPGLMSGLVVAGANREPKPGEDDGILTALEVAEMDLSECELAVLSACETGLGKGVAGEGMVGLQRAFQVAGARSVVASLWQVDDRATRDLMSAFYRAYLEEKGATRVEALRQAQVSMLRDGVSRGMNFEHAEPKTKRLPPYYWAAFVLSGDWR